MAEEVKNDEPQAEKPLDKMTVAELREALKKEVPDIKGLSSMKKDQLLEAVMEAQNSKDESPPKKTTAKKAAPKKVAPKKSAPKKTAGPKKEMTVSEMKQEIVRLRAERESIRQEGDKKKIEIIRRRINRLKKLTRKAA